MAKEVKVAITARISPKVIKKLDAYTKSTRIPKEATVENALEFYLGHIAADPVNVGRFIANLRR